MSPIGDTLDTLAVGAEVEQRHKENPKKYTQAKVAVMLGVSRETVRDWEVTSNGGSANGCKADARVKLPAAAVPVIVERVTAGEMQEQVAAMLSVSERTVRDWLSRIDKDSKEARNRRIFDLWLACWTVDEIAAECNCGKATISEVCSEMADLPESNKPAANHLTDFTPPIYNVWKQPVTDVLPKSAELPDSAKPAANHLTALWSGCGRVLVNGSVAARALTEPLADVGARKTLLKKLSKVFHATTYPPTPKLRSCSGPIGST